MSGWTALKGYDSSKAASWIFIYKGQTNPLFAWGHCTETAGTDFYF